MPLKLYELADQYRFLIEDNVDTETGEIISLDPKDFQAQLAEIRESIGDKAENIGKLWLELQSETKAISSEIDRLSKVKSRIDQKAQWLKDYLLQELDTAGLTEIKRPTIKISIRINPPSVNILEMDSIPENYKRLVPAVWEADKKAILNHYKETGESTIGIEIVEKRRIDIK